MKKKMLRCIDCQKLICLTPFDSAPGYQEQVSGEILEIVQNDKRQFQRDHQGHRCQELTIGQGTYVSEFPWAEPIKEGFFEAFNKRGENFVVRQWRDDIYKEMQYEIIGQGYITVENVEVAIQREFIEKQLESDARQTKGCQIREWAKDFFIAYLQNLLMFFPLSSKEISNGRILANTHPLNMSVRLSDRNIESLFWLSKNIFEGKEGQFFHEFVKAHLNDVLAVKVKRSFDFFVTNI